MTVTTLHRADARSLSGQSVRFAMGFVAAGYDPKAQSASTLVA